MTGIFGLMNLDGRPADRGELQAMAGAFGAAAAGEPAKFWISGAVGLAHRARRTTPESLHETQPLVSEDASLAITADVRIDNREELLPSIGDEQARADGLSDAEVLSIGYRQSGAGFISRVLGDFAFGLFDAKRSALVLARDAMGVRPLYYHYVPGRLFAFSNDLRSLLALDRIPKRVNEAAIADFLLEDFENTERTFHLDIQRVPPAHVMELSGGRIELRRYWNLDASQTLALNSDEDHAQAYLEVFRRAVDRRLRWSVPAGAMLSGGLDSSPIVCLARQMLAPDPLPTFSVLFASSPESDEREYIQTVIDQGGLEPHFVEGGDSGPLGVLDEMISRMGEPFYNPNLFLYWKLWSAARNAGVRVVLDGQMGDVVATHGYARLDQLARRWQVAALAREWAAYCRLRGEGSPGRTIRASLWHFGVKSRIPEPLWRWRQSLRGGEPCEGRIGLINPEFARRVGLQERLLERAAERRRREGHERACHVHDVLSGDITAALEVYARAIQGFGLEARLPYLDRELVEFCVSLPADQKLRDGFNRFIVRNAFRGILPEKIRLRVDKGNLGDNFNTAMRRHDMERMKATISCNNPLLEPYLDVARLRRLQASFAAGGEDGTAPLWLATVLAAWMEKSR